MSVDDYARSTRLGLKISLCCFLSTQQMRKGIYHSVNIISIDMFLPSKDNVSKAKHRIILASLYLGTGAKEQQLVSDL